jgi:hypothetical protein
MRWRQSDLAAFRGGNAKRTNRLIRGQLRFFSRPPLFKGSTTAGGNNGGAGVCRFLATGIMRLLDAGWFVCAPVSGDQRLGAVGGSVALPTTPVPL